MHRGSGYGRAAHADAVLLTGTPTRRRCQSVAATNGAEPGQDSLARRTAAGPGDASAADGPQASRTSATPRCHFLTARSGPRAFTPEAIAEAAATRNPTPLSGSRVKLALILSVSPDCPRISEYPTARAINERSTVARRRASKLEGGRAGEPQPQQRRGPRTRGPAPLAPERAPRIAMTTVGWLHQRSQPQVASAGDPVPLTSYPASLGSIPCQGM
jgi:hypothetical protein